MVMRALAAGMLSVALFTAWAPPASACLSCGCGGSGTSADLGAQGAAAALFAMGSHWLVQESVSFRSITGSFNERGEWNPPPIGGSLQTIQSTLGLSYIPMPGASLGLQLPLVANALDQASWGPLGSINPTDLPRSTGVALGDVAVQGSLSLIDRETWAIAGWTGASVPTGLALGDPSMLSGSGVWNGSAGLLAIAQPREWELVANVGYQRPFGRPPLTASTYYVGEAWLYQASASHRLFDAWRAGIGVSGYRGEGRFGPSDVAFPLVKLKVMPTLQYEWNATEGVRFAVGFDPVRSGANSLSDVTAMAVLYQFIP